MKYSIKEIFYWLIKIYNWFKDKMKRIKWLDTCLGLLICAMIVVVCRVVGYSYENYSSVNEFTKSAKLAAEKLEKILPAPDEAQYKEFLTYWEKVNQSQDSIDTTDAQGKTLMALKQIKEILDTKIPEQKAIIDTNNYVAIILTLITVCLTLSTIIPYIVGKSVGKNYVKDAVNSLYQSNKEDVEKKYDKVMSNIQWAEAHLSRMTSYMLTPSLKAKENPYWAIGWASKSLIRYITLYSEEGAKRAHIEKFCEYCITYINESAEDIRYATSKPTCDDRGIIIRAFTDMFDVLVLYEKKSKYPIKVIKENIDIFNSNLSALYEILIRCYPNENEIQSEMAKKTKFTEFLPGRTKDDFISYLKEWLNRSK